MKMLFPALPGLLLIASGYGIAEQTLLPTAQNSHDVMLLPSVGDPPNDLHPVSVNSDKSDELGVSYYNDQHR
ncbi:multiple antibiotic resistance protein MarB [Salmonella enterica]|uniref:Multiple antibiotic resistance protein MarB n=1 Tax=Salmonella enterica subsp. houtenae serovar 45:g,z51:- TaxID=1967611 RepID=A0A753AXU1_SALHO|nr:multiple antibiotic resistance protein MarB [Salmonella enterica]EBP3941348.1 multiple antibiotic resistance protein MarB [Salmonella enterica subsp. enterica]HAF0295301.1 multiple antibiotic resistance protein MarB [Salmonella enterica subsp. houtenae serovar 43:z4,z32:-]AXD31164.1 multiple antibiotic resistance protein MarB [Salmonella enterica]EAB6271523.1 multiple antibiotic resistance protein MarB [Salmonella enterica subsp. houtenae]EAN8732289.1 multiple antibiotic resistance protein 